MLVRNALMCMHDWAYARLNPERSAGSTHDKAWFRQWNKPEHIRNDEPHAFLEYVIVVIPLENTP